MPSGWSWPPIPRFEGVFHEAPSYAATTRFTAAGATLRISGRVRPDARPRVEAEMRRRVAGQLAARDIHLVVQPIDHREPATLNHTHGGAVMSFDVAADAYDAFMGRWSRLLSVPFADLAEVRSGQTALDVGCGTGALTAVLVARLGPVDVAAADPSAPFVGAMRERFPGVDVREAPAERMPFPADGFDVSSPSSSSTSCPIRSRGSGRWPG